MTPEGNHPMEPSLHQIAFGFVPAQIVHAAAQLGVADALAEGPCGYAEVAERTGTDPTALRSLLRALVGLGLAVQTDADRFALTEAGRPLRGDAPDSVRADILLSTMPELWRAWGALVEAVRNGVAPQDPATGLTAFEATLRDPAFSSAYRGARADSGRVLGPAVARACDFGRFR
jgi:hypothetical protein